jgi:hypothetical protein
MIPRGLDDDDAVDCRGIAREASASEKRQIAANVVLDVAARFTVIMLGVDGVPFAVSRGAVQIPPASRVSRRERRTHFTASAPRNGSFSSPIYDCGKLGFGGAQTRGGAAGFFALARIRTTR